MVRPIFRIIILATFLVVAVGCARWSGGIAPSNVPVEGRNYRILGEVKMTDTRWALFGLPGFDGTPGLIPLTGSNTIREALEEAISSKGADALINITVETYIQNWLLFTRVVTVVEGQAIRFE